MTGGKLSLDRTSNMVAEIDTPERKEVLMLKVSVALDP